MARHQNKGRGSEVSREEVKLTYNFMGIRSHCSSGISASQLVASSRVPATSRRESIQRREQSPRSPRRKGGFHGGLGVFDEIIFAPPRFNPSRTISVQRIREPQSRRSLTIQTCVLLAPGEISSAETWVARGCSSTMPRRSNHRR